MFGTMTRRIAAVGLLLCLAGGAAAGARYSWASGTVSGWNTVDYIMFDATNGDTLHYKVSGSGSGSNKLTVKVQQQKSGGDWKTIKGPISLDMPSDSSSGTFVVEDLFGTSGELCRFKFSRDLGTKAIDWKVDYLY